jgi:hypothetical protein
VQPCAKFPQSFRRSTNPFQVPTVNNGGIEHDLLELCTLEQALQGEQPEEVIENFGVVVMCVAPRPLIVGDTMREVVADARNVLRAEKDFEVLKLRECVHERDENVPLARMDRSGDAVDVVESGHLASGQAGQVAWEPVLDSVGSYVVVDANGPRGAQDDVGDFVAELSIQGGQRRGPCRANDVESVLRAISTAAETTIAKFECDWVVEIATVAVVPAVVEACMMRRGCMFPAALDGNAGLD